MFVRINVLLSFCKGFQMKTFRVGVSVFHEITKCEEVYVETAGKLTAKEVETALEKDCRRNLEKAVSGDLYESMDEWDWAEGLEVFILNVAEIDSADKSASDSLPTLAIDEDGEISCLP